MQQGKQGDNVGSCCFACLAERVPLSRFWRDIFGTDQVGAWTSTHFSFQRSSIYTTTSRIANLCSHIAIKFKLRDNHDVG